MVVHRHRDLQFAQSGRLFDKHLVDPGIEEFVSCYAGLIQVLMCVKRVERQRLGAPQQFYITALMLNHLDGLRTQGVAWLFGARDENQQLPFELASQGFGEHPLQ